MRAAAYLRVSSKAQTLDMQRAAILWAAKARGDVITIWYSEKQSAKTITRPALTRLRTDARSGRVRRLYIYRLDRLARSGIRDTFEVVEELRQAGCEPDEPDLIPRNLAVIQLEPVEHHVDIAGHLDERVADGGL